MLKSYPVANQADPREYVVALAGALVLQPREIAMACAHPVTGVVRGCMFKPTVADIARWCEREAVPLFDEHRRLNEAAMAENMAANAPGVVDRRERPSMDELHARYGPDFGIKRVDALDKIRGEPSDEERERRAKAERAAQMIEHNRRSILAEYARLGQDPVYAGDMLVSPSLVAALKARR